MRRLSLVSGESRWRCFPRRSAGLLSLNLSNRSCKFVPSSALFASTHTFSTDAPPPPIPRARDAANISPLASQPARSKNAAAAAAAPFSPSEVRALVFPMIPSVPSEFRPVSAADFESCSTISGAEVLRHIPKALRSYLDSYRRVGTASPTSAAGLPCEVWSPHTFPDTDPSSRQRLLTLAESGVCAYLIDHFPQEIILVSPGARLVRRAVPSSSSSSLEPADATAQAQRASDSDASTQKESPTYKSDSVAFTSPVKGDTQLHHVGSDGTAPPPPPQPNGPSQRYGSGAGSNTFFGAAPLTTPSPSADAPGSGFANVNIGGAANPSTGNSLRSTIQLMELLVEFIPTFYVSVDVIEPTIPSSVQELYAESSLRFFLKRFRHYVDLRTTHGSTEVRLRPTFDHPKRGMADARLRVGGGSGGVASAEGSPDAPFTRRPPRNSEANLIGMIAPRVPKTYTPLAEVLQEISPIISRHAAFDARFGVTGLLGKYPEYFQIVDGQLRARPYREAPNSLKDLDRETSPLPQIFAKVMSRVEEAAEGKNYAEAAEKAAATVSTGRLYSLLTPPEKTLVKQRCRSFPTFLRLHGKEIVVSVDKMRVYKFIPEHEACVDTLLDERLRMNAIDPNDPILKIPAEMAPDSNAEWAIRELYDALPLMQCAELDEVLSLVPPAVRDALPREVGEVRSLLEQYGDYFSTWLYPDDETVIVVQRAKVQQPEFDKASIVRMVVPLIPQGGTTLTSLRTRAPLQLQRYFYRHGTVATLGAMKDIFAIAGDRIVRLV